MESAIQLSEIERLAAAEAPDLADAIISLLDAGDPSQDHPEGSMQFYEVLSIVRQARFQARDEKERKTKILDAWNRFLKQTNPPQPPRFGLAELIVRLYEEGTDSGRATVIELAKRGPLQFGLWGGLKRVYKLAESRLDADMWGVLAWRFDTAYSRGGGEVSKGTLLYLRRRVWRFLRNLGQTSPSLYPQFAVQALRHYEEYSPSISATWIPNHVFFHQSKRYDAYGFSLYGVDQNDLLKHRAFDEQWKKSPSQLMYLLETCQADMPAKFAIQALRKDFPEELRKVSAAWLARLAFRKLASAHEFLVETLQASPEYHQGKLKAQGLHDAVLELLGSESEKARTYAIEYARGHAQDLDAARLLKLADSGNDDTVEFATKAIMARAPKALGYEILGKALAVDSLNEWAAKSLNEGFDRNEIPEAYRLEMIFGADSQRTWVVDWFKEKFQPGEVPVVFWKKILEDKRSEDEYDAGELATEMLGQVAAAQIGSAWMLDHLDHGYWGDTIGEWLSEAESLPDLDVERVKGLVFHRSHRHLALQILGNTKLVKARDLGLAWLLALARREDSTLHDFAHRYLLEHMEPADFADEQSKGVDRLFGLATGKKEPEPVRVFAQTYLRCHHPVIGPSQEESKQFSLTPKVSRDAYTADRIWPSLFDARPDVRKFAVSITRAELRRWNYVAKVYDLTESEHKEVRNVAYDALLKAGEPNVDENCTLEPGELDSDRVFGMTESRFRSTREVAMDLIRRHYARLGGPERLAWLMQSNDRTVRMLAVRLLWEKHRPRAFPNGWKARVPTLGSTGTLPPPGGGGGGAGPAPSPATPAAPAAAAASSEEDEEDEELEEEDEEAMDEDADDEGGDEDMDEESGDDDEGDDDESGDEDEDEELGEDEEAADEDMDEESSEDDEESGDEDEDEDLDEDDGDEDEDEDEDEDDFLEDDDEEDEDDEDDEEEENADASSGTDRDRLRAELIRLLDELELSVRTANALSTLGATYIGDLIQYSEVDLLKTKNFGRKSLSEIKDILAELGFALGTRHEPWWPTQIKAKGAVAREELEAEFDDGDEDDDEGTHDPESTVIEAEMAGINCPKCAWVPHEHDHWLCSCGFRWNTFRTRAKCPRCAKQWEETACLKCKVSSPHTDWWVGERSVTRLGNDTVRDLLGEAIEDVLIDEIQEETLDLLVDDGTYTFVGDLVQATHDELADLFDEDVATEVESALRGKGLQLGMIWDSWWPNEVTRRAEASAPDDEDEDEDEPTVADEDEELDDESTVVSGGGSGGGGGGPKKKLAAAAKSDAAPPTPPNGPETGDGYSGPFRDVEALRDFLRRILYGLPPGRSMEPKDDVKVRRHLPANVAKKNAIEVVRDLAIEDADFAKLVVPVLSEFTGSIAKGEWQACLTALVQIANTHPGLDVPGLKTNSGKA